MKEVSEVFILALVMAIILVAITTLPVLILKEVEKNEETLRHTDTIMRSVITQ